MIILCKPGRNPTGPPLWMKYSGFQDTLQISIDNHLLFTISTSISMSASTSRLTKMTREESDGRDTRGPHSCTVRTSPQQGSASVIRAKPGVPASQPSMAELTNVVFYWRSQISDCTELEKENPVFCLGSVVGIFSILYITVLWKFGNLQVKHTAQQSHERSSRSHGSVSLSTCGKSHWPLTAIAGIFQDWHFVVLQHIHTKCNKIPWVSDSRAPFTHTKQKSNDLGDTNLSELHLNLGTKMFVCLLIFLLKNTDFWPSAAYMALGP